MKVWLITNVEPITATVSGVGGGGVSVWVLVNHVTSIAAMIGAIAGAVAAVCSAGWWLGKLFKAVKGKKS